MNKNIKIALVVFFVILLGLGLGASMYLLNQRQTVGSQASGNTVMYFSETDPEGVQRVGEQFSINVVIDTKTDIASGVDSIISFDPDVLEVVQIIEGSSQFADYPALDYDNDTGDIIIGANSKDDNTPIQGNGIVVAQIIFNPLQTSTGTPLTFDFTPDELNDSNVSEFIPSGEEANDLLETAIDAVIVIEDPADNANLQMVNLNPSNSQNYCSEETFSFSFDIIVNTEGADISGVDTIINYDPAHIEITEITPSVDQGFLNFPLNEIDNITGVMRVSGNVGTEETAVPINGQGVVIATVTGNALAASTSTLTFDFTLGERNDSNVTKYLGDAQESVDILTSVGDLQINSVESCTQPSPTPSVSPSPSPTTTVSPTPTVTPTVTPTPTATPTVAPTATPTSTPITTTNNTDDTVDGTTPLPESLPDSGNPWQTAGLFVIAVSFITSGIIFRKNW